jgi:hypothetical protein
MEWKTDKDGRRYREISKGCIEYEPMITTTYGTFPESMYKDLKIKTEPIKESKKNYRDCPFNNNYTRTCNSKCAFYSDAGCMKNDADTNGKKCPFNSYLCNNNCMLYDSGCKIVKAMREVM